MLEDIKTFFSDLKKNLKSKRIKLSPFFVTVCILIVLIPTMIAVYYAYFYEDDTQLTSKKVSVELYDINGNLMVEETVSEVNINDSPIVSALYNMSQKKIPVASPPDKNAVPNFTFTVKSNTESSSYRCYFNESSLNSYIQDSNEKIYSVEQTHYNKFLNSKYSETVYPNATPPALLTGNGESVTPRTVSWSYKKQNGSVTDSKLCSTEAETLTYRIGGSVKLNFASAPDTCKVEILDTDYKVIYNGDLSGLPFLTVSSGEILTAYIDASWGSSVERAGFGDVSYVFNIVIGDSSVFSLDKSEIYPGEFAVLSGTNIDNVSNIIFTPSPTGQENVASPLEGFKPIFVGDGKLTKAYLPISSDAIPGTYEFSVSFGATMQSFSLTVLERTFRTVDSPKTFDELSVLFSDTSKKSLKDIINGLRASSTHVAYDRGSFTDPTTFGFSLEYGYNDSPLPFDEAGTIRSFANVYNAVSGESTSVRVLNIGIVAQVEHNDILGNYVIVDHGAELYTWYCNLSTVNTTAGSILSTGEIIGQSGASGPMTAGGVTILCSVYDVFINPSFIIEREITVQ